MDDATKELMLDNVNKMEEIGLAYLQHGVAYQNPHYDMSFILKDLSVDDFNHLKTLVGQNNTKIQEATVGNYHTIPFTATEHEQLKKDLAPQVNVWNWMLSCLGSFQCLSYLTYPAFFIASFFITPPAKAISDKLQFDFHSLITAFETYVNNYDRWTYHQREIAWLDVGKAQRDVPAHVAQEYCRRDRSFEPRSEFNEEMLPRVLTFYNSFTKINSWFPLSSLSSGLGVDFALSGWGGAGARTPARFGPGAGSVDLAAVRHLDEVRIADLTQSRENLSQRAAQIGLAR